MTQFRLVKLLALARTADVGRAVGVAWMKCLAKAVVAMMVATIPSMAVGSAKADFGSLTMCSALNKLPAEYRTIDCNGRNPPRQYHFILAGEKPQVNYLVDSGSLVCKWVDYAEQLQTVGPFRQTRTDSERSAMSKANRATGLVFGKWPDAETPGGSYYQSEDVAYRATLIVFAFSFSMEGCKG